MVCAVFITDEANNSTLDGYERIDCLKENRKRFVHVLLAEFCARGSQQICHHSTSVYVHRLRPNFLQSLLQKVHHVG